ncbi:tyrosine-type recombinase/integrase [Metallibacterium scheffleri]
MDLSKVANREKLKPRREPYWHRLEQGRHLGYRPAQDAAPGGWIAKAYDAETLRKHHHALGNFADRAPNERFAAARKAAQEWFEHLSLGGAPKVQTVGEACKAYAADKPDAEARFKRQVYGHRIATILLHKLTERQVLAWRAHLEALPVARGEQGTRAPASLNRDMVPMRAALNLALRQHHVASSLPWREALAPAKNATKRRNLYLDREQRRALLAALPADLRAFAHGLCLLPLRPGALAALTVGDFDVRRSELVIARDKAGAGRGILLPAETAALLKAQGRSKLPAAPLFTQASGKPWRKDDWAKPFKRAVREAELPEGATAYTLRHSTITDLVAGGLDLLTIAQISGTSVAMIEAHYGHLRQALAAQALAGLAL